MPKNGSDGAGGDVSDEMSYIDNEINAMDE